MAFPREIELRRAIHEAAAVILDDKVATLEVMVGLCWVEVVEFCGFLR